MRNPYEILGINDGSSKDEIKRAYRELAKKYHPDQYGNNPLRELAETKMREINEAYDYLMKTTSDNSYSNSSNSYHQGTNNQSNSYHQGNSNQNSYNTSGYQNANTNNNYQVYTSVRADINRNNISNAERVLNNLQTRDAEWYFLMGYIHMQKGWVDSSRNYLTQACNMNPNNMEYRQALNALTSSNNSYRNNYYNKNVGRNSNDSFNCCMQLWCLDSICECMGGDLIGCC